MAIPFNQFVNNAYYYILQTLESDSVTKVSTKHGNVVVIPEERYDCLVELLVGKQSDTELEERVEEKFAFSNT